MAQLLSTNQQKDGTWTLNYLVKDKQEALEMVGTNRPMIYNTQSKMQQQILESTRTVKAGAWVRKKGKVVGVKPAKRKGTIAVFRGQVKSIKEGETA